ncbi:uncharacterized protein LOC134662600 [Cydia amplana]|uniref:uncharacterized protein LOC134662600 n=1 Tax=Cydia amplana TaxID=1869771 RepID=UPI002FE684EC
MIGYVESILSNILMIWSMLLSLHYSKQYLTFVDIINNTDEKKLKQLLKVVSTRPLYVKSFGALSFNMTLVPACFSVIISSTVIALQFNNVI